MSCDCFLSTKKKSYSMMRESKRFVDFPLNVLCLLTADSIQGIKQSPNNFQVIKPKWKSEYVVWGCLI